MEILIIGDKHGNRFWKKQDLENHLALGGTIVDLGDYFDSFNKSTEEQLDIFRELVSLKEAYPKQVVLLLGNHDVQYFSKLNPLLQAMCSGFQEDKRYLISDVINPHFDKFQFIYSYENYLFSHAGITNVFHHSIIKKAKGYFFVDAVNKEYMNLPEIYYCSRYNGGFDNFDGPLWVRPTQLKNDNLEDYIQVVGHTQRLYPEFNMKDNIIFADCKQIIKLEI
jgi:hypothetical protein